MKKTIELLAKRPKHKDLVIVFYDTPLGRKAFEKEKEKLTRRGYSVTSTPNSTGYETERFEERR